MLADIFTGYPYPQPEVFNPDLARAFAQAGYPVTKRSDGSYECPKFPSTRSNTASATSNKIAGEFMQAQWKQNLGIATGEVWRRRLSSIVRLLSTSIAFAALSPIT